MEPAAPEVGGAWEGPASRRRRLAWAGAAAVVVVVVALVAGRGLTEDEGLMVEEAETVPVPQATEEPTPTAPVAAGAWQPVAGPPVDDWEGQVVWSGREALVWGVAALATYDPATAGWWQLEWPLAPRTEPALVWAPERGGAPGRGVVIVWGGRGLVDGGWAADGAAYDPAAKAWRVLPEGPLPSRRAPLATWSGEEMLVAGGVDASGYPRLDAAAYDPIADAWRRLPRLPGPVLALEWVDRQAIAVLQPEPGAAEHPVVAYRPGADAWRELPPVPTGESALVGLSATTVEHPRGPRLAVWSGGEEGQGRLWVLDHRARRWAEAPPAPLDDRMRPALAWTGDALLVWGGHRRTGLRRDGAVYQPEREVWHKLPEAPLPGSAAPSAVWTGAEALVFASSADAIAGWQPEGALPLLAEAPGGQVHLATAGTLLSVDLATRGVTRRRVSSLAPSGPSPLAAVGDALVYGGYPETFAVAASGGDERSVGRSHFFLPDPAGDRVWLVRANRDGSLATPVGVDGVPLGPERRVPGWVDAATGHGLAVSRQDEGFVLWDPDRDAAVWEPDEPMLLAAGRDHVATCSYTCTRLRITDLRDGAEQRVRVPAGAEYDASQAAFAADGSQLALFVRNRDQFDLADLAIIDVSEGSVRTVDLGTIEAPLLAWDPVHAWLYAAGDGRLLAVAPDADEARLVINALPENLYGIAVTDAGATVLVDPETGPDGCAAPTRTASGR